MIRSSRGSSFKVPSKDKENSEISDTTVELKQNKNLPNILS